MVASARRKLLGGERPAVFHCWTCCVRRAFLCGRDRYTQKDYSHRRDWIVRREEQLAGLFALEIEFRAELSNHLHNVLRTLPQVARRWSAREVARRWLTITKLAKCLSDDLPQPDPQRVERLATDNKKIQKLRRRLSSISWFMGVLCENIARRANAEDECHGRFWETRYRCRECTDESALLLCGIYVDLNPFRAGEADCPETARYASIFQRLQSQELHKNAHDRPDAWLGELTRQPERKADEVLASTSRSGRRASDWGILPVSLEDYVKLLKWTAQLLQSGQRSTIPSDLAAVLDHLDVKHDAWLDSVEQYEQTFGHAVGRPASLVEVAERMELQHLKGVSACRRAFT